MLTILWIELKLESEIVVYLTYDELEPRKRPNIIDELLPKMTVEITFADELIFI